MGLARYHARRNFQVTPEPRGRISDGKTKALSYVIQKHAARHLHYDFRLELDGVLLSWAVPKGPSLDPADKRLAMHVEDHPLEYGDFEGTIPARQYGGGTVMVWDRGTWVAAADPRAGYAKGHLKFDLAGKKLKGRWALVRTSGSKYGGKGEPWLLIKDADAFARRGLDARVVDTEPNSVVSERSMDEIAAAKDCEWNSNRSVAENLRAGAINGARPAARKSRAVPRKRTDSVGRVAGAQAARLPSKLAPMLATLGTRAPEGADWLHEAKYDGYRMLCRLQHGKTRMYSRSGKDWTEKFLPIAGEIARLKAREAWLDGEACVVDSDGRSSFQALQNALSGERARDPTYIVFDLIHLDGYDLRNVALVERKRLLQELIGTSHARLRYSPVVQGAGADVFKQTCPHGLEGMVSKKADSVYIPGLRSLSWLKVKCTRRQELVIGGFTDPQRGRVGFGALLLGVYESGRLVYSGKVGTGFDDKTLVTMRRALEKIEQRRPPFTNPPRGFDAKGAHWVKPALVAEVEFSEWSDAGALRNPSFLGLRTDKKAADVVREAPDGDGRSPVNKSAHRSAGKTRKAGITGATTDGVAGVKLSHPDKPLFPEVNLTKLALARYYESIAEWILPYIESRPLSLLRCPDGWNKECFYQKHADQSVHGSVERVTVAQRGEEATYFAASSLPALVGLVQWGVLELHPWGSRMPHPERPDRLIFDFDPADDVPWPSLVTGARLLRTLLGEIGLTGFLKTTGGKGLHVVVPIQATLTWEQAKGFTRSIAELMARTFPDRFTAALSKSRRKGRIFIDYLRNAEGATAIAAYSFRARSNAPVSTPIAWTELSREVRFDFFNVATIPSRLKRLRQDPWEEFHRIRQTVSKATFEHVGYSGARELPARRHRFKSPEAESKRSRVGGSA